MQSDHSVGQEYNSWQPCPRGELQKMVARLDDRQGSLGRAAAYRTAGAFVLLVAISGAVVWGLSGTTAYGSLTCAECQAQFDPVHRQVDTGDKVLRTEQLSAVLSHLEHCEHCREAYRQRYPVSRVLNRVLQEETTHSSACDEETAPGRPELLAAHPPSR